MDVSIESWLENFKNAWLAKDITAVLALFADDVEYWESPFKRLHTKADIETEWQAIHNQHSTTLDMSCISTGTTNTVTWNLTYMQDDTNNVWAGIYVIKLNNVGLCTYFYQVGEKQE